MASAAAKKAISNKSWQNMAAKKRHRKRAKSVRRRHQHLHIFTHRAARAACYCRMLFCARHT